MLGFSLSCTPRLQAKLEQQCTCCRLNMNSQQANESRVVVRLIGSTKYAACPKCGQDVGELARDTNYRQRCRRWYKKVADTVAKG